jgi:hypothetical protein
MKPLKTKYLDTTKVDWKISKKSKLIIDYYAKYTKYEESEIIDKMILEIMDDSDFIQWLGKKRYKKKFDEFVFKVKQIDDISTSKGADIIEDAETLNPF